MNPADLDGIRYLPSIRSRQAELRGYRQLSAATIGALRPIVALGKLGQKDDASRVLEAVQQHVPGEFFLDLNSNPGQRCATFEALCSPEDDFGAWRELARDRNAVPIALLRDDVPERRFVRQVMAIEREHGVVMLRSRRPARALPLLQTALSVVDDVNNLIVVLDFGYIRGSTEAREQEALRVINALRSTEPSVRIVVMSSSFPKAISAYGETGGALEIVERDFHRRIGGDEVAIYGDHASIYPEPFEPSISRFVPRIDYCLDLAWLFDRRRSDDGGYVQCARNIVAKPDWEPAFADVAWGAGVIREVAATGAVPAGFGSPANWIAARLNMHIERQHALSLRATIAPRNDGDDGDELEED